MILHTYYNKCKAFAHTKVKTSALSLLHTRQRPSKAWSLHLLRVSFALLFFFSSCGHDHKQYTDAITCRDSVPQMTTYDITSLVSDSGVVRYKIVTSRWDVYDRLDPSRWSFEEGVYLEKFTDSLTIDATVKADTAYYYDKEKLWELRGHVHIENLDDEIFDTSILFWNQSTERVWSDEFITIRKANGSVVTGFGFTSNQQFTNYSIRNTQGTFPVEEQSNAPRNANGEIVADSTVVGTASSPTPAENNKEDATIKPAPDA